MTATRRAALFLLLTSAALLLGALGFQYLGGLPPCEMCYWQRYAHIAVLAAALPAVALSSRPLAIIAIVVMLVAAGLGLFHAGVEQGWWQGPTGCSSTMRPGMSQAEILSSILSSPLVRCDRIAWQFLGLSMAAWNALLSALAVIAALYTLRRR